MSKEMIWVAKGGRPCKNKPDMDVLKTQMATMSFVELKEYYKVSQATMYRYIREAKMDAKDDGNEEYDLSKMTKEQLIEENKNLKKQVQRLQEYIKKL